MFTVIECREVPQEIITHIGIDAAANELTSVSLLVFDNGNDFLVICVYDKFCSIL